MGINKEILRLALPSILANITIPLVGMVDIAVAGHLDTSAAALIGGISVGSLLFDLLYWNFGFLRAGTSGLTAQAYGRSDYRNSVQTLQRALTVSIGIAALLIAIQWIFIKGAFLVISCSEEVHDLASQYFFIRIWAAPATLSIMAFKGWFIGMQDSFSSMLADLVINGVNIAASIILTLGAGNFNGIGFAGIAAGTVIAQYSGLLLCISIILLKYRKLFTSTKYSFNAIMKSPDTRKFFSMNTDLFFRSICFVLIYEGFTLIAARYGDTLLAVSSILMKILMVFSFFTDGFAYAGEAMTGKYIGRNDWKMVHRTIVWTFVWSMGIALLFIFIYYTCGIPMVRLMTADAEVIEASRQFIPWLLAMPLLGCAAFTWDGIYIGATDSRGTRDAMILAALAFFGIWFAGSIGSSQKSHEWHIHLLMGAYFAHLAARTIYLTVKYINRNTFKTTTK